LKKTVAELLQEEKDLFEADPVGIIKRGYLEVRDKSADLVPLVPNSTQSRILETIQMRRRQSRPAFLFILKARQLGVSTIIQAVLFAFAALRSFVNALDVADDIDGASYIFKMNELFYERLRFKSPHLVPEKSRSDEKRLEFEGTHSRIMIDTANNSRVGRKYTLQLVHLSEVAFYKNFNELLQALRPAVSDAPDTIFVMETTANGINEVSKFYWKIKAAYEADPDGVDWIPMFCSWKEHLEYRREFSSESFKEKFVESMSDKEKKIMADHALDLEQMYWRRRMIEDAFGGDDEKFQVEYPLTDKEAFVSTAKRVFPERLTEPQRSNVLSPDGKPLLPKLRGEIERVDRRPAFVPDAKGFLRIYQEAQPEERYVIGADSCESALTHDEACAQVLKRSTWTQVAHLHGHMNPEDFAERLFALGLYYNRALLCPERNGPGLVTLTYLAKQNYPNLCHQPKSIVGDDGQWTEAEEYGFHTNAKTKPLIIDQLQNALRSLLIVIKDPLTLQELEMYVVKQVSKEGHVEMGAEEGHRDDCVMALAISLHYAQKLPALYTSFGSGMNKAASDRRTGY
jgi:hypothetical protein